MEKNRPFPVKGIMPRRKMTETIHIVLDDAEQLEEYRLTRISDGRSVVTTPLMLDHFRGRPIGDILRLDAEQFCSLYASSDGIPQHTLLRHFVAVKCVLDAYTGRQRAGPADACSIVSIDHGDRKVAIDAILYSEPLNEKTEECVRCPGCRRQSRPSLRLKGKSDRKTSS
jgi:hypothetical protein